MTSSALDDLCLPRLEEGPDALQWEGAWIMYWLFEEESIESQQLRSTKSDTKRKTA